MPSDLICDRRTAMFVAAGSWIAVLLFALPAWFALWSPALQYRASATWVVTPCVITEARVRQTGDGNQWCIELGYDYRSAGSDYRGERLAFAATTVSRSPADLPNLPGLGASTCFVDPAHPERAVLLREYSAVAAYWSWGMAGIVMLLGYAAFWWTRRLLIRRPA